MNRRVVSVLMPAYNEGLALGPVLERLGSALSSLDVSYETELIVIDDGSRDETASVIRAYVERRPATIALEHPVNRGLVEALKTGSRRATGAAVVMLDADLSYAPEIVEPLVRTLFERDAAVVIASPYMRGGRVGNVPFDRLVASRAANVLLSALVGGRVKTLTGMVRAYDAVWLARLIDREIPGEFNAGMVAEIIRSGGTIVEIPAALVWPASRTEAPSRMTARALARRIGLVARTARVLAGAEIARRRAGDARS